MPGFKAKRKGCFALPARDGENAGAHHFGDERGGIDRQPKQQRDEFRRHFEAAGEVEAAALRQVEGEGEAENEDVERRRQDHHCRADQEHRRLLAGRLLPAFGPEAENNRSDKPGEDQQPQHAFAAVPNRLGQYEAAIVEETVERKVVALARFRQRLEHGVVPEQQLQQQRNVADGLDVTGAGFAPPDSWTTDAQCR